jgi:D-tyrosyl-tRNA(Tyr) deacylase
MRLVVQRVEKAKVVRINDGQVVGEIGKGLMVLVGFKKGDSQEIVKKISEKLLKLRVMSDSSDKMNLNVKDAGGSFLIISQFTLHADTTGGNRPSFIDAENPLQAKKLYEGFVSNIRSGGIVTETGSFGDYMKIEAVLDGPVTILNLD